MIIVLFEHIPKINSLSISAIFGFILLVWSASNIFRQLKNFLVRAWAIEPTESNNIKDFIRDTNRILYYRYILWRTVRDKHNN